ncbi:MAG: transposase [Thermocladium sp.]
MPIVGFRFRAYTDGQTLRALKAQLEAACEVYNTLRWADTYFYHEDEKGLTLTELRQLALDLRKQDEEYQQLYSQVVQQIADRYYEARQRFFDGLARFPREKKTHKYYSLVYPQSGWRILAREGKGKNKKRLVLRLSSLGVFKLIVHRDFPLEKVKRVAVKLTRSEMVFISFIVEDYGFPKLPNTGEAVGIDVGVEKLLVTSDGEYLPNLRPYEKALKKVKRLHKELSRKKFLSKNWFKAKMELARAYEHLANLRKDLYMKLGRYFAEHYDVVVMEDISVKQLIGKSNRGLRMRLHDVAFHELRSIVEYQMGKYGKKVVLVDPRNSSKTCAKCGYVKMDLTLSDRVFECPRCGWRANRDYNSALNHLKNAGWEPPVVPVELRPLPITMGKAGQGSGKPLKDGVAHLLGN